MHIMPPHTNLPKLGVILGDFSKLRVIAYSEGGGGWGVHVTGTTPKVLEVEG